MYASKIVPQPTEVVPILVPTAKAKTGSDWKMAIAEGDFVVSHG